MEFRVLGPLQVHGPDGQVCPLEPRQARVLAMLLLADSQVVGRQHLIDAVWDDAPPNTAERQLLNLVSRLRQRLAEAGAAAPVIVTDGPGYRIRVDDGQLDAHMFAGHLSRAQVFLSDGQPGHAAQQLRAGLALWRGPALAGITGRAIEAGAARLDEQRLATIEQRLDLELRLGRHHDLIAELTEMVATHPLRERLVGQLMLALHRSGRQADALNAYRLLCDRLAGELGIDPGPAVQDLHTAVLRNQAGAVVSRAVEATAAPRQLPAPVRHFVGRTAELKDLTRLAATAAGGGPVVVTAIGGTGGIGKTALALHWAHQVADQFPDGQLYLNLRGFDPTGAPMPPAEAIRAFLDAFAVPAERIPVSLDAQAALYRSLIAGRRILVVLDNALDAEQIRPLIPGTSGCLVLVTSRNHLTGLIAAGAHPITLDLLTFAEGHDLLARHLGLERLADQQAAVHDLIDGCARLPLALAIVAARAAAYPTFALEILAAELADTHQRLDALDTNDQATQLRAVFSWSYRQLSPAAARVFRLLGRHPGPDISGPAAASLAGVPPPDARPVLVELIRAHLLVEHVSGRYTFHDLLRDYASEQARTADPPELRHAATHRMLDHYLHSAYAADRLIDPLRSPITPTPPQLGVTAEEHADRTRAMAWFAAEYAVLLAIVQQAADAKFDAHAWQLAWALTTFVLRQGHWHDWAAIQESALSATRRLADRFGQANAHRSLGQASTRLGRYDHAETHYRLALDLYAELDDSTGQAHSHIGIAHSLEKRRQNQPALWHLDQALDLYRAAGDQTGQARALNAIGWCSAQLGNHQHALTTCRQALALQQQLGDHYAQAITYDSLGYAHHQLGHHHQAIKCYQRAIVLFREFGDPYEEASTLNHLGDTQHAAGIPGSARATWEQALAILTGLDHPHADQVRTKLHRLDQRPGTNVHRRV